VFNIMSMATQQQREQLARIQQFSYKISYTVHTDQANNRVEFTLTSDDPEAAAFIPQMQEGIVETTCQLLYHMFAMKGERI